MFFDELKVSSFIESSLHPRVANTRSKMIKDISVTFDPVLKCHVIPNGLWHVMFIHLAFDSRVRFFDSFSFELHVDRLRYRVECLSPERL